MVFVKPKALRLHRPLICQSRRIHTIQWTNQDSQLIHVADAFFGKTCASESRLVLISWLLIGWQSGASFLSQSPIVVMHQPMQTRETRVKTALFKFHKYTTEILSSGIGSGYTHTLGDPDDGDGKQSYISCFQPIICVLMATYIKLGGVEWFTLENSPKQVRTLIGLKPCFYLTIRVMSSRFLSRDSWRGRSPSQLSRDRNRERII